MRDDLNRNASLCKYFERDMEKTRNVRSINSTPTRYLLNLKSISKCLLSQSSYFRLLFLTTRWLKRKPFNSSQTSWVLFFPPFFHISFIDKSSRAYFARKLTQSKRRTLRFLFGAVRKLIFTHSDSIHMLLARLSMFSASFRQCVHFLITSSLLSARRSLLSVDARHKWWRNFHNSGKLNYSLNFFFARKLNSTEFWGERKKISRADMCGRFSFSSSHFLLTLGGKIVSSISQSLEIRFLRKKNETCYEIAK